MKSYVAAVGLIGLASAVPHAQTAYRREDSYGAPTVTVKNGTIAGVHKSNYKQDYFLGISDRDGNMQQWTDGFSAQAFHSPNHPWGHFGSPTPKASTPPSMARSRLRSMRQCAMDTECVAHEACPRQCADVSKGRSNRLSAIRGLPVPERYQTVRLRERKFAGGSVDPCKSRLMQEFSRSRLSNNRAAASTWAALRTGATT